MRAINILDRFRLDGQVAVITGGGRGIGRAIALAVAEAGADVVVAARRRAEIEAVAREVRERGRRALAVPTDVLDGRQHEALAQAAMRELGRISLWVNNAGGAEDRTMRTLLETPEAAWDNQIDLNLKAVWMGSVAAGFSMRESGGAIVNVTSMAAHRASPTNGPYAAAKAGAENLTRTLAAELAPRVRVNAIAPGPIPTEVFLEATKLTEAQLPMLVKHLNVPLQRLGTPEDVASAVVFLASPAAAWITGQVITVNGGL